MKKALLYILACLATSVHLLAQSPDNSYVENQLFVKIQPKVAFADNIQYIPHPSNPDLGRSVWNVIKNYQGINMINIFPPSFEGMHNVYKVTLKEGADINGLVKALSQHEEVEYVERIPKYYIDAKPIDLDEEKQWYMKTINMNTSWDQNIQASRNKSIAVIDNGVLYTHEDLNGSVATNNIEMFGIPGVDDDGNGYIDDVYGWDVADNDPEPIAIPRPNGLPNLPQFETFGWHGTHVAGIIAASADNNKGIASIGKGNRIVCIKAASSKGPKPNDRSLINLEEAFTYAIKREVDIINCSFGTKYYSQTLQDLIQVAVKQGIVIVAAAGNSPDEELYYPAAYDGVIAVGATNKDDVLLEGTRFASYIDVMAPGYDIYSTTSASNSSYGYMSGTSMAAPIVTSIIGLILSNEPDRVFEIEDIIKQGCDNIDWKNPSYAGKLGAGRVNVDRCFSYMENVASVLEVTTYTGFNVYPNPAVNTVYIPFGELSENGQAVTVKIINTLGAEVAQQNITGSNQPISVAQLAQGMYQMVVTNSEGKSFRSQLVINH